jgi:hypothetical protein
VSGTPSATSQSIRFSSPTLVEQHALALGTHGAKHLEQLLDIGCRRLTRPSLEDEQRLRGRTGAFGGMTNTTITSAA